MKQWKRMKTLLLLTACAVLAVSGCCAEAKDEAAPFVPKVLRYVAVPEDAFGGIPGGRVAAVAEDGNKLLVIGRNSLYLWDAAAGQRMPVYFSQEEDMDLDDFDVDEALDDINLDDMDEDLGFDDDHDDL